MLGSAMQHLEELARFGVRFADPAQQMAEAKPIVENVVHEVREFAENVNASPGRLEEIEDRLAALDRLKRKYGQTLAEVIAFGEDFSRRLAEVENRDALLVELKAVQEKHSSAYRAAASCLTTARKDAAKRLE